MSRKLLHIGTLKIQTEMEKLGLSEIRTDNIFNVSGVRKGNGGGPTVVFAAHMEIVFPALGIRISPCAPESGARDAARGPSGTCATRWPSTDRKSVVTGPRAPLG